MKIWYIGTDSGDGSTGMHFFKTEDWDAAMDKLMAATHESDDWTGEGGEQCSGVIDTDSPRLFTHPRNFY